jgi:hypothetical protein
MIVVDSHCSHTCDGPGSWTVVTDSLIIGAFPFGLAGGPDGLAQGPRDDPEQIGQAIERLQGDGPPLLGRTYVLWSGTDTAATALSQVAAFVGSGVPWDLVLCYRDQGADLEAWASFASRIVQGVRPGPGSRAGDC